MMSYLSRIKQVEEEKRRQSGTGAKPQTGAKTGTGAAARNANGTIKATIKTNAAKSKAAQTVSVPGASAAGKAAGGQARTMDARVTWSTLSDMKQRGAIPSAAKTRAADVRTVKPAGSDAVGAKSTQTGAAGMKIKPLDLNNPGANADVNALIGAPGGPGGLQGGSGAPGGETVMRAAWARQAAYRAVWGTSRSYGARSRRARRRVSGRAARTALTRAGLWAQSPKRGARTSRPGARLWAGLI